MLNFTRRQNPSVKGNPFRDPAMRAVFDECVAAHLRSSPAIKRGAGNAVAVQFWRGYDGVRLNWDAASKRTFQYAQHRAGQHCANVDATK